MIVIGRFSIRSAKCAVAVAGALLLGVGADAMQPKRQLAPGEGSGQTFGPSTDLPCEGCAFLRSRYRTAALPASGQLALTEAEDLFRFGGGTASTNDFRTRVSLAPGYSDRYAVRVGPVRAGDETEFMWGFPDGKGEIASVRPSDVWLEFDVFLDYDDSAQGADGRGTLDFFRAETAIDGTAALTFGNVNGDRTRVRVPGQSVFFSGGMKVLPQQWNRIRVHYVAATDPGTTNDGTLDVWLDIGDGFLPVIENESHTGSALKDLRLMCRPFNAVAVATTHFRRLSWAPTEAELWQEPTSEPGAQTATPNGRINARMWARYQANLHGISDDVIATFEVDTDPGFPSPQVSQSAPIFASQDWTAMWTARNLQPSTTYYHRVRFDIGGSGTSSPRTVTGATGAFRTLSAPGSTPRRLRFVVGSCSNSLTAPMRTFDSIMATDFPLDFWYHGGDTNYHDNQMNADDSSTVADFWTCYNVNMASSRWHRFARSTSSIITWDDHEVKNAYAGIDWENNHSGWLREAELAANHWLRARFPEGTSSYLAPVPPGTDAEGVPYSRDSVFQYYFDTAGCRFIVLDTRRFRDPGNETMLGPTQLAWVKNLLETNTKPVVMMLSQVVFSDGEHKPGDNWGSHVPYRVERDEIVETFVQHNPDAHLYFASGDHHYGIVSDATFPQPNVGPEVMVGAWSVAAQEPGGTGFPGASFFTTNGVAPGDPLRLYALFEIDEPTAQLRLWVKSGDTGRTLYSELHPCMGDWNGDGQTNQSDMDAYMQDFNAVTSGGEPVRWDPDVAEPFGVVDQDDLQAFVSANAAGCDG